MKPPSHKHEAGKLRHGKSHRSKVKNYWRGRSVLHWNPAFVIPKRPASREVRYS